MTPAPSAPFVLSFRPLVPADLDRLFRVPYRALGEAWLARQARGEIYVAVAEADGQPVGRRCLNWAHGNGIGWVFAASVREPWRSRGIGSGLDGHLGAVAAARGLRALRCVNAKTNRRAFAWHARLGYRVVGEGVHRWIGVRGKEVAVECWELERPLGVSNAS